MGANFYTNFGEGTDPRSIFNTLRAAAEAEHGHQQGYSGEINAAYDFRVVRRDPVTMSAAREIAQQHSDDDNCEKGGPAYAVPVAESTVKGEKVVKVKVQAADRYAAQRAAEAQARSKATARVGCTVEVKAGETVISKAGKAPKLTAGASVSTYSLTAGNGYYKSLQATTQAAAIKEAQAYMTTNPLPAGAQPRLERTERVNLTATGATVLPTFEVQVTVRQVKVGKVRGYLFFGLASC